jgi:hypothetical protein
MSRLSPEELLAIWAHRPEDLSADERREVEALLARDPDARRDADATRALLQRVADLPAEGTEPAWDDLAAGIRAACAGLEVPAPSPSRWARWRTWMIAGAGTALVASGAAIALWAGGGSALSPAVDRPARMAIRMTPDAPITAEVPAIESLATDDVAALIDAVEDNPVVADAPSISDDDDELPADLAWIDTLDESSVDELVRWLDTQPG